MLQQAFPSRPKTEKLLVFTLVVIASLTLVHAIYYAYSTYYIEIHSDHPGLTQSAYYSLHNTTALSAEHPLFSGKDHAPNQYRIGVELLAKFIADRLSIGKYYIVFSGIDFLAVVAVCGIFYGSLVRSRFFLHLNQSSQTSAVAFFLVSLAYPFAWVVPWERPETLPTALYLAVMLILLNRLRSRTLWLGLILLATVWQASVRADVPMTFGLAVALFSFTRPGKEMFGSWKLGLVSGVCIAAVAVSVQAYLKLIVFPHATYPPDTPVVVFFLNFKSRSLATFLISILPYVLVLFSAAKYWRLLDPTDILVIIASCIYLPLWITLGIAGEVRIFVPFLFALTPAISKLILLYVGKDRRLDLKFDFDDGIGLTGNTLSR
jgi:hypothetical protein